MAAKTTSQSPGSKPQAEEAASYPDRPVSDLWIPEALPLTNNGLAETSSGFPAGSKR